MIISFFMTTLLQDALAFDCAATYLTQSPMLHEWMDNCYFLQLVIELMSAVTILTIPKPRYHHQ